MSFPTRLEQCRMPGLAAGLAALLAACTAPAGSTGPLHWARLGGSFDQFMGVRYACIEAARSNGFVNASGAVSLGFFKKCMEADGWYVNPAGYAAPANYEVRME